MKILAIIGSPREEGNTAQLVKEMVRDIKGAEVKTFHLNKMDIRGCQACMYCRSNPGCIQPDEMQQIYKELTEADLVVVGFPIYMWQMTGQTKLFVDRLFAYYNYDGNMPTYKDKGVILAICQGAENGIFKSYIDETVKMFRFLGFKSCEAIVAGGVGAPGDVLKKTDTIETARLLVRNHLNQ